jgi:hypothetical protein
MSLEDLIKRDKAHTKKSGGAQRGGRIGGGGFKGGRQGGDFVPRLRKGEGIFKKDRQGGPKEGGRFRGQRDSFGGQGQRITMVSRSPQLWCIGNVRHHY